MEIFEAIRGRRAVRAFTEAEVDREQLSRLIDAAIQAPSATNAQPWVFAVIQDRQLLHRCSERAKAHLLETLESDSLLSRYRDTLADPAFDIFYHAPALIVICARPDTTQAAEDCALAAQNLMLAAHAMGLGTCPIGFARSWLNLPEVKRELGIPSDCAPVLPLVVGHPRGPTASHGRNAPHIVSWQLPTR
jgi:nitroreductase